MFHPGGSIAGEGATPLGKLFAILPMAGFLACVPVFVALPFIAGAGLGVVIHGTASIREGALPWLVPICVGALMASLALDPLVDTVADRFLPGNRLVAGAAGVPPDGQAISGKVQGTAAIACGAGCPGTAGDSHVERQTSLGGRAPAGRRETFLERRLGAVASTPAVQKLLVSQLLQVGADHRHQ